MYLPKMAEEGKIMVKYFGALEILRRSYVTETISSRIEILKPFSPHETSANPNLSIKNQLVKDYCYPQNFTGRIVRGRNFFANWEIKTFLFPRNRRRP